MAGCGCSRRFLSVGCPLVSTQGGSTSTSSLLSLARQTRRSRETARKIAPTVLGGLRATPAGLPRGTRADDRLARRRSRDARATRASTTFAGHTRETARPRRARVDDACCTYKLRSAPLEVTRGRFLLAYPWAASGRGS